MCTFPPSNQAEDRRSSVGGKDTLVFRVYQDETTHQGAQRMLASALEVEVEACLRVARDERDAHKHTLVV